MFRILITAFLAFTSISWAAQASDCKVLIKKINVTENGYKKIDEVREHKYALGTEESCFDMAQKRLSFYPQSRSYYGSIVRSELTQSFLYRGKIDVYYFADYEFTAETAKSKNDKSRGRIQRDSKRLGMNPVIGRYGNILIKDL